MNKAALAFLLVVLTPLTHLAHVFTNNAYKKENIKSQVKFNLPSSDVLKAATIGYDHFVADLLWLQLIQYIGTSTEMSTFLPENYSLIDSITTLDPQFIDAYIFGSYALTDNKEFDKAIAVLEKGIRNNPKEWYLLYQIGFLYYINKKNKVVAARYLSKAGDIEGAPAMPKRLAAMLASNVIEDLDVKIALWQSAYEKADQEKDKVNKEKAYKKLVEFKIEKDIKYLNSIVEKYNSKNKVDERTIVPDNLKKNEPTLTADIIKPEKLKEFRQLVEQKYIKEVPLDPLGRPYMLNPDTQEIKAFPLPWNTNNK
ncbi:MAG: hypothetical protein U0354_11065 [Candidatus Sericytochromatia bacterium]